QSAILLGCSAGTVKSQTSKGLAALRRMLEPAWGGGSDRGSGRPADSAQPAGGHRAAAGPDRPRRGDRPRAARGPLGPGAGGRVGFARRGRRWRRVRAGVSVLLAAGAPAAVAAALLVPAQRSAQRPDQQPTGGPA